MIEVGDKVIIKNENKPVTVKHIIVHDNFKIGPEVFKVHRLYFEEDHQPEFDWRVTKIIKKGEDNE